MDRISSNPSVNTTAARSDTLSASQRNAIWENGLKENIDKARNPPVNENGARGFSLGASRIDRYEGKVKEDMKAFIEKNKDNPNLTEKDIQDELKKSISKRYGYEFVNKMTDDYFFNKLMSRAKELSQDAWS